MLKEFFKRYSPNPERLRKNKALNFLGERIYHPSLWHLNRHSVAKAFAVGLFCTWLPMPFQTVIAAALAIFFSAHIPLSIVLVFITNPITIPPMFYFAYRLGNRLLLREESDYSFELSWEWVATGMEQVWQPLLLGSLTLAAISSILGYISIHLVWRYNIHCRWKERRTKHKASRLLRKQQKKALKRAKKK
ncbi:MAG: DUF2062 domain-containing protein [Cocleimonas sp.]|nr:DUF2062 domain-containing protein [Cocleimonas sp.]